MSIHCNNDLGQILGSRDYKIFSFGVVQTKIVDTSC